MVLASTDPRSLTAHCERVGVDLDQLQKALDGRDNWGKLVHSVHYLRSLGAFLSYLEEEAQIG